MRLLLDEHYSPKIAQELRRRGHDVESVKERDDLRGLGDVELWNRSRAEGKALMTENVADFMPFVREAAAAGEAHPGIVFTSSHSLPRAASSLGLYTDLLDSFLRERPRHEALADQVFWLSASKR